MDPSSFIIGIGLLVLGLAIAGLSLIFLRANRVKNSLTGIVTAFFGIAITWLSLRADRPIHINIGIPGRYAGLLLASFVFSLFILKGIVDIWGGSKKLQSEAALNL